MRQVRIERAITPKNEDTLSRYYAEVDKQDLISVAEEVALAKLVRLGDKAALDKLVSVNLRFVISVAKKYQQMGMPFADLVAEGNTGLIRAAKTFDETKGFKFISYAVWWVRLAMVSALSNHMRTIRLPENMVRTILEVRQQTDKLEQELERVPTDEELAERVPYFDPREPVYTQVFDRAIASLDTPLSEDGGCLGDILPDEQFFAPDYLLEGREKMEMLGKCLESLDPIERQVVKELFGFNQTAHERTLEEVGQMIGFTGQTVFNIRKRSLSKLRMLLEELEIGCG